MSTDTPKHWTEAENARLLAAQAPRPVPAGERTNPAPGWQWCCTQSHPCRYLVNIDGPVKANGSRRCADTIAETWSIHDADNAPALAARIEALEAELRVAVQALKLANDNTERAAQSTPRPTVADSEVQRMAEAIHESAFHDRESARRHAHHLLTHDDPASSMHPYIPAMVLDPTLSAAMRIVLGMNEPRPTVDSRAPSRLDEDDDEEGEPLDLAAPPPGWEQDYRRDESDPSGFSPTNYLRRSPPALADLGRAHEYYRTESAPAVAVATATLVAERDAARRGWARANSELEESHHYGRHATEETTRIEARRLFGDEEAARLFPASPRAEREQADG